MNPTELAKLAALIGASYPNRLTDEECGTLAALLAGTYVMFERTAVQIKPYCEECGFSGGAAGHHPRCSKYDRYGRIPAGRNAL